MSTSPINPQTTTEELSIFENPYDKEILAENLRYDSNKARNSLLIIAGILLLSDLLALSIANALNGTTLIYTLVVPVIFIALAFLAMAKPMLAMGAALGLFVLIIAYTVYALGARAIISGLLVKAVIVYFFVKGFNHAKEAETARKNLSNYQ
jgi:hypothetical protein